MRDDDDEDKKEYQIGTPSRGLTDCHIPKPQMSVPEKLAIEIAESEAKIEKLVEEMTVRAVELTNKIYETVANVTIAEILTLRYVAGLKVEEIARRLNFTRDYVWKLHNRGLRILGLSDALPKTP